MSTPTGRRPKVERLTTLDASFLYLEKPDNPMHVAGVLVLEPPAGGLDAIAALIEARLPLVPRYRQRVRPVPMQLGRPLWVDDAHFQILYHVRHTAVPSPSTSAGCVFVITATRPSARPSTR